MQLKGWVIPQHSGCLHRVFIEAEAPMVFEQFLLRIEREKPATSFIPSLELPTWVHGSH
jgi:hypothetical protein